MPPKPAGVWKKTYTDMRPSSSEINRLCSRYILSWWGEEGDGVEKLLPSLNTVGRTKCKYEAKTYCPLKRCIHDVRKANIYCCSWILYPIFPYIWRNLHKRTQKFSANCIDHQDSCTNDTVCKDHHVRTVLGDLTFSRWWNFMSWSSV